MDYEQYTINETPVEEQEETKNEIVPVEAEEPEKKAGNTAAGVAFGALLTVGIFAAFRSVKRAVKHVKAKAAKKAEACEDDEWEAEPIDEPEVVLEETTEKTKKNK